MSKNRQPAIYTSPVSWVWLALLFVLTVLLLGTHYETNDDLIISWLLRGKVTGQPVTDFRIFLHGLGEPIAGLYSVWPTVPWYGAVLYLLLFIGTLALVKFLSGLVKEKAHTPKSALLVLLALVWLAAWAEHLTWFSFVRVAVLLGAAAVWLYSYSAIGNRRLYVFCGLLLFVLGLCLRVKAACLGAGLALPFVYWLAPEKEKRINWLLKTAAPFMVAALLLYTALHFSPTKGQQQRRVNQLKSYLNEYYLYRPLPQTQEDTLALQAVEKWLLADEATINPALFRRAGKVDMAYFTIHKAPLKAQQFLLALARDYSALVFANALLLYGLFYRRKLSMPAPRLLVLWQVCFWAGLAGLAIVLKLPPRLATSLLGLYTLGNLALAIRYQGLVKLRVVWVVLCSVVVLLQLYKVVHRSRWQHRQEQENIRFITALAAYQPNSLLVTANLGDQLTSLSPFTNIALPNQHIISITGWPTLLPYYQPYLTSLTGEKTFAGSVQKLAEQPQVYWVMSPAFAHFLPVYLSRLHHLNIRFQKVNTPALVLEKGYQIYTSTVSSVSVLPH